jgi:hypothetical protein
MIFAFVEDGTVEVLESETAAQTWEPIDVESRVVVFYADDGTWLEPRFTRPHRHSLLGWVLEQGAFELVRNPTSDPAIDPIDVALSEAVALEPNPYFRTIEEIRRHVALRRASAPEPDAPAKSPDQGD